MYLSGGVLNVSGEWLSNYVIRRLFVFNAFIQNRVDHRCWEKVLCCLECIQFTEILINDSSYFVFWSFIVWWTSSLKSGSFGILIEKLENLLKYLLTCQFLTCDEILRNNQQFFPQMPH